MGLSAVNRWKTCNGLWITRR